MTHYDDPELVALASKAVASALAETETKPSTEEIASAVLDAVVPCIAKKVVCEIAEAEIPRSMSMRDFLLLQAQALDAQAGNPGNHDASTRPRPRRRGKRVGAATGAAETKR